MSNPAGEGSSAAAEPKAHWLGRIRIGIVPRLGFAFCAVTALAIAANYLAENGNSIVETTSYFTGNSPAPAPLLSPITAPAPAAEPGRKPVVAKDLAAESASVISAIELSDRVLHERLSTHDDESVAAMGDSLSELSTAVNRYAQSADIENTSTRNRLSQLLADYANECESLVKVADASRDQRALYFQRLDSLESGLRGAIDSSWKIFGRLVARPSLINLGRIAGAIRQDAAALVAPDVVDGPELQNLLASEETFEATLNASSAELERSKGKPWVAQIRTDFSELVAQRMALQKNGEALRTGLDQHKLDRDRLVALVPMRAPGATSSAGRSAKRAIATGDTPPPIDSAWPPVALYTPVPSYSPVERKVVSVARTSDDSQARQRVKWITALVLIFMLVTSISTTLSIVRPVRRLIEATQRLSAGSVVQVARGGIKELDVLTAAFNDMALELASAREQARMHQNILEARVEERTRALQHLVERDPLTELPNRRQLFGHLNHAIGGARSSGRSVGVFFLDLDNFKTVNDSMGHAFGDRVLQSVAQRLEGSTALFGIAARLGGDEFTVVYPDAANAAEVIAAGQKLCEEFQKPLILGDRQLQMSVSIGVSVFPDHGVDADSLLRAADAALYRAKEAGRSQIGVFSSDLLESAVSKFGIEQGLRTAIHQDEFELVYQPEVNLGSLQPTMVEALVRWRRADGRLLAPNEFFGVAEDSGLIMEISDWALRTAIAAAADWYHGLWPNVRVAINISPRQLTDPTFVDRVKSLLVAHRLPPTAIELELTENVLQTGPATIEALRRLRAYGIPIALDDFGTGYSSLSSLELLPLTRVKLDRSLIASIESSEASWAIASAIIGLCDKLGVEVTAEGVERPEQLTLLKNIHQLHVQGYLISRPVPGPELLTELTSLALRMRALLGVAPAPAVDSSQSSATNIVRFSPR